MSLAIRKVPLGLRVSSGRLAWIVTALLLLLGTATAAYGFWASTTSSSNAAAAADALSPGSKPAVTASGASLSVSWAAGTTVNGRAATGYTVTRYATDTGGTGTPATGGCAGTITTLTCTEQNVPGGKWYYTITPTIALWTGAESPRSTGVSNDALAPTVSVSVSPTPVSGWNNTSPVTFTITAEDGTGGSGVASVSYAVDGGAQQTVSGASATGTVSGDGTHTVSYFATDKVGNSGTAQTQTVNIDTKAPAAPVFTVVPPYAYSGNVNAVSFQGTTEANTRITLTASDGVHSAPPAVATANGSGVWTASIDVSSLDEGGVAYSAVATDAAGNVSPAGTATNTKDTAKPASAGNVVVRTYINSATSQSANTANASSVPVSGTAEANATVTVTATSSGSAVQPTKSATAVNGNWSLNMDLSSLVDGTVTYTLSVRDVAGNISDPVTHGTTSLKDTAAPAPTIDPFSFYINSTNNISALPVRGSTEAGATVTLTVRVGLAASFSKQFSSQGTGWSTTVDLSTQNDGPVTFTAVSTDAAGNSGTFSTSSNLETTLPKVTAIYLKSGGTTLGKADAGDSVTIEYSEALDGSKICTLWGKEGLQTLAANNDVTVTINHSTSGTTISNTLTVASKVCPGLNIGTISLGSNANYAATTTTALDFVGSNNSQTGTTASTVTWDPNANPKSLTIKLGDLKTNKAGAQGTNVPADTPTYTPASGLTDIAGNPLGTASFPGSSSRF